jgi:hypothetical protein
MGERMSALNRGKFGAVAKRGGASKFTPVGQKGSLYKREAGLESRARRRHTAGTVQIKKDSLPGSVECSHNISYVLNMG